MKILDTIKKLISKESDGKDLESPKYFPNPANPAESISSADTNEKTRDKWERAFAPVKCKAPDILISAHFNGKHFLGIHINLIRGSFLVDALTEKGNKGYLEYIIHFLMFLIVDNTLSNWLNFVSRICLNGSIKSATSFIFLD